MPLLDLHATPGIVTYGQPFLRRGLRGPWYGAPWCVYNAEGLAGKKAPVVTDEIVEADKRALAAATDQANAAQTAYDVALADLRKAQAAKAPTKDLQNRANAAKKALDAARNAWSAASKKLNADTQALANLRRQQQEAQVEQASRLLAASLQIKYDKRLSKVPSEGVERIRLALQYKGAKLAQAQADWEYKQADKTVVNPQASPLALEQAKDLSLAAVPPKPNALEAAMQKVTGASSSTPVTEAGGTLGAAIRALVAPQPATPTGETTAAAVAPAGGLGLLPIMLGGGLVVWWLVTRKGGR